MPGSLRKYFLRYVDCSAGEKSAFVAKLKETGAEPYGVNFGDVKIKGQDELALIFPSTERISDTCGAYLGRVGAELKCPPEGFPEKFVALLLAYSRPTGDSASGGRDGALTPPDVTREIIRVSLFDLLGNRPIARNVAAMFVATRSSVGGKIELIDLHFENSIILRNVRIENEDAILIPAAYRSYPIKTVGVADRRRHLDSPPLHAELGDQ